MSKFTKVENNSKSIKRGSFKREELETYGVDTKDIDIIMEYQKKLPILQEDDGNWIDARVLHEQLGIGAEYTTWFKRRVNKYMFEENVDYIGFFKTVKARNTNINTREFRITMDMAKQLTMVENNELGVISRKYFIAIERAFKDRKDWNFDRIHTIVECEELKHQLAVYNKQLFGHPDWMHNKYVAEFCMLNEIIIGMSSKEYKLMNGLKKNDSIRNIFTEEQLEYVHELERYDADLIGIQNMFNYNDRFTILSRKFSAIKDKSDSKTA